MCSSTPKVQHTRRYARHWAVPTSVSITANDFRARWYSVRTHTVIVATNTSGHSHTPVPRQPKNEWINWRKQVSAANLQAIMEAVLSSSATLPKPKHYSKKNDKMLLSHIESGRQNREKLYRQCYYSILMAIILNLMVAIFASPQKHFYRLQMALFGIFLAKWRHLPIMVSMTG